MTSMKVKRVPMYCELLDGRVDLVIQEKVQRVGTRDPTGRVGVRHCSEWKSCRRQGMDCKWARLGASQVDPLRELK